MSFDNNFLSLFDADDSESKAKNQRVASQKIAASGLSKAKNAAVAKFSSYLNAGGPAEFKERLALPGVRKDLLSTISKFTDPTPGNVRHVIGALKTAKTSASDDFYPKRVSDLYSQLYVSVDNPTMQLIDDLCERHQDMLEGSPTDIEFGSLYRDLFDKLDGPTMQLVDDLLEAEQDRIERTSKTSSRKTAGLNWKEYGEDAFKAYASSPYDDVQVWKDQDTGLWTGVANSSKVNHIPGVFESADEAKTAVENWLNSSGKTSSRKTAGENPFAKKDDKAPKKDDKDAAPTDPNAAPVAQPAVPAVADPTADPVAAPAVALTLPWQPANDAEGQYFTATDAQGNILDVYPFENAFYWQIYDAASAGQVGAPVLSEGTATTVEEAQAAAEQGLSAGVDPAVNPAAPTTPVAPAAPAVAPVAPAAPAKKAAGVKVRWNDGSESEESWDNLDVNSIGNAYTASSFRTSDFDGWDDFDGKYYKTHTFGGDEYLFVILDGSPCEWTVNFDGKPFIRNTAASVEDCIKAVDDYIDVTTSLGTTSAYGDNYDDGGDEERAYANPADYADELTFPGDELSLPQTRDQGIDGPDGDDDYLTAIEDDKYLDEGDKYSAFHTAGWSFPKD